MSELSEVITARDEWMDKSRPPASTVVEVAALYDPRVRVEVEALATTTGS
jgi:2-iminobutanoate/2-iminopropanoate deaminase